MPIVLSKVLTITILGSMMWLTLQCPCKRLLCCHLGTFWALVASLLAVVFYENGFKMIDPSCVIPGG